MQNRSTLGIILVAGLAMACSTAQSAEFSDASRAAIKATSDSAMALANATPQDWAAYTRAVYTTDAAVLPPNAPTIVGHEAITTWLQAFPKISDFSLRQTKVEGAGDFAFVVGRYSIKVTPPGASAAIADSGKYIEIWRKQSDGSWRMTDDIFNSDVPLPEPAPAPPSRNR
jgi:ketosteroid isomerase-like protein